MNRIFQILIRFYQLVVSPIYTPCCRFYPSCSEYARQAFAEYGIFTGSRLTLFRLLRCQPFCRGGFDPVPSLNKQSLNRH